MECLAKPDHFKNLKTISMYETCSFDEIKSLKLLAQLVNNCHSLEQIDIQMQYGKRVVAVRLDGDIGDPKRQISVYDSYSRQKVVTIDMQRPELDPYILQETQRDFKGMPWE